MSMRTDDVLKVEYDRVNTQLLQARERIAALEADMLDLDQALGFENHGAGTGGRPASELRREVIRGLTRRIAELTEENKRLLGAFEEVERLEAENERLRALLKPTVSDGSQTTARKP